MFKIRPQVRSSARSPFPNLHVFITKHTKYRPKTKNCHYLDQKDQQQHGTKDLINGLTSMEVCHEDFLQASNNLLFDNRQFFKEF